MKTKRIIAGILSIAFAISAFGTIPVMAENDEVVYTYADENGNIVNITRSEIDAEHWNTELLGDHSPMAYKDFPVMMNPSVDDFANLSLEITYLKNTSEFDNAIVTITDMYTNAVIYNEDIAEGTIYTDNIAMDGYYQIQITETFVGEEERKYTKYISTAYENADMPDYVTNPIENDTEDISIIDTAKYEQATSIDEEGRELFDADIASFDNVSANEWAEFRRTLAKDKLYKVVVGSGNNIRTGFISTFDWGDNLGIFRPEYRLYSEDISAIPSAMSFDPSTIKDTTLKGSYVYDVFGDEVFTVSTGYYKVFQYTIKDNIEYQKDIYNVRINVSDSFSYLIWYQKAGSSTIKRNYSSSTKRNGIANIDMSAYFDGQYLDAGDTMYFVIYVDNPNGFSGSICIENESYDDDVTGSAYTQYKNGNSIGFANFNTMGSYEAAKAAYSIKKELTDIWDVDTFYLNNTANSNSSYSFLFTNKGNNTDKSGMAMTLMLYYVDFSDDTHFILKRKSSTSAKINVEKGVNFVPTNSNTKYFLEVMSSDNDSNKVCQYDKYEFYTVFYPES